MRLLYACFVAALGGASVLLGSCVDSSVPAPSSPLAFCEGLAAVDCKVYWTCLDPTVREAGRAGLLANGRDIGLDQRTCTTNLQAACKPFTCGMDETFQETKASVCIDTLKGLSCEVLLDDEPQINCGKVCTSTTMNI